MAQGKQAKVLTEAQAKAVLRHLSDHSRYPERDRAMFLLSAKAGLRAKEIAGLEWSMVTDAEGNVAEAIELPDRSSKGKKGGRTLPLNAELRKALMELQAVREQMHRWKGELGPHVITSERSGHGFTAGGVTMWFWSLFKTLGYDGCSSHSGRRTFITKAARKITEAGGSLRDVQQLAGHSSLATTQRYIEGSTDAKRKLVDLI